MSEINLFIYLFVKPRKTSDDDDDIFVVEKICETVVGYQSAVEVFFLCS